MTMYLWKREKKTNALTYCQEAISRRCQTCYQWFHLNFSLAEKVLYAIRSKLGPTGKHLDSNFHLL